MSETPEPPAPQPPDPIAPAGDPHTTHPAPPAAAATVPVPSGSPLVRFGGVLGILACVIGLAIFLLACAGWDRAVTFSYIPPALGVPGLLLAVLGAVVQKHRIGEDTHVLQALFTNSLGIVGGLLEMAVWRGWPIFQVG